MQVIILAGGEGSRLRPLTQNTPKPLVRLLGVSTIERLLALLFKCGFREATVCDFYLAENLEKALGEISNGVKLSYSREETPLGTAGCARKAWQGDDVLLISGDGVHDFDYKKIIEFHKAKNADVTIVSVAATDPREYGLITADKDGKIIGFCEKPSYDSCLTDIVNTGVYVISKKVMERIANGEKTDFAKDVFPQLIREGKSLYTVLENGVWQDIGDISSLLNCQTQLLSKEGKSSLVFKGATVEKSAVIGAGSVIEEGAYIGENCRVFGSLVMKNSSLGEGTTLNKSVVAENVTIGRGCSLSELTCVGEGSVLGSNVHLQSGVRVAVNSKIPYGARIFNDIGEKGYKQFSFADNGICEGVLSVSNAVRLGASIAQGLDIAKIFVGFESYEDPICQSVILGLRSAGCTVYFAKASIGQTVFIARHVGAKYAVFFDNNTRLLRSDRITLSRSEERKIELLYNRGDVKQNTFAPLVSAEASAKIYMDWLKEQMPQNFGVKFKTKSKTEQNIFSQICHNQNSELVFHEASYEILATQESAKANYQELILIACLAEFEDGKGVSLPENAPFAAEELAKNRNTHVVRVGTTEDLEISPFAYDNLALICKVCQYLTNQKITLLQALLRLPPKIYTQKIYGVRGRLPKIMHQGFADIAKDGKIRISNEQAQATVTPLKNGKAVRLYVESVSQEAAKELCDNVINRLSKPYKP